MQRGMSADETTATPCPHPSCQPSSQRPWPRPAPALITHEGAAQGPPAARPLSPARAPGGRGQDNFVSHTMKAEEEANLARIREEKSKADVANPLEPLIVGILKGYVDDADLSARLQALYTVPTPRVLAVLGAAACGGKGRPL